MIIIIMIIIILKIVVHNFMKSFYIVKKLNVTIPVH